MANLHVVEVRDGKSDAQDDFSSGAVVDALEVFVEEVEEVVSSLFHCWVVVVRGDRGGVIRS